MTIKNSGKANACPAQPPWHRLGTGMTWNSSHGPSDDNKKRLLNWRGCVVEKSRRAHKNHKVPKAAKIQLLHIYYPKDPPTWKDEIPVAVDDNTLWVFKPVEWLDDLTNNWLEGNASVLLTEEERIAMEKMLWVKPWLLRVEQKREARAKRMSRDS